MKTAGSHIRTCKATPRQGSRRSDAAVPMHTRGAPRPQGQICRDSSTDTDPSLAPSGRSCVPSSACRDKPEKIERSALSYPVPPAQHYAQHTARCVFCGVRCFSRAVVRFLRAVLLHFASKVLMNGPPQSCVALKGWRGYLDTNGAGSGQGHCSGSVAPHKLLKTLPVTHHRYSATRARQPMTMPTMDPALDFPLKSAEAKRHYTALIKRALGAKDGITGFLNPSHMQSQKLGELPLDAYCGASQ